MNFTECPKKERNDIQRVPKITIISHKHHSNMVSHKDHSVEL